MAAYDEKLTRVKHLEALANRVKTLTDALDTRVTTIEGAGYQNATDVQNAINARVSSVYKPGGSKTAAELTSALLVEVNEGKVFNLSDALTTTADFVEGAGKTYPAGTNVVVINAGTSESPSYKFDVLAGFVDLGNYVQKAVPAAANNFAALDANGNMFDSGHSADDFLTEHQDISGKADLSVIANAYDSATTYSVGDLCVHEGGLYRCTTAITSAEEWTAGHWTATDVDTELARRDSNVNGKIDKVAAAVENNIAIFDANGGVKDSGVQIATDTEVTTMLNSVFGTPAEPSGT